MTNVEVLGKIKHKPNDDIIYLEVLRSYKDVQGNLINDLLPSVYWAKEKRNLYFSLKEDTRVFIKGRLEIRENNLIIIVEEFRVI